MGALEYLSKICSFTTTGTRTKSIQTVEIKVKMDCDGCERKVRNAIRRIKGVKSIDVNRKQSKVTVNGFVEPNKVLRNVKRTGKRAEFWPYIPCSAVYNPSSAQTYDRRAPPGHVKNAQQAIQPPQATDQRLAYFFSDDNPNACSIM